MNYYIYVDDIRKDYTWFNSHFSRKYYTPIICTSYQSTIDTIEKILRENPNANIFLDLDHDLGDLEILTHGTTSEKTGYDICMYVIKNKIQLTGFHIHSMNPVGATRMNDTLVRAGYVRYF